MNNNNFKIIDIYWVFLWASYNTGWPCFSKVYVMPFCFYERPTLAPVFTNRKKSQEDVHFYEKREIVFNIWCAVSHYGGSTHPKQ